MPPTGQPRYEYAAGLMGSLSYRPGDTQPQSCEQQQIDQTSGFLDWMGENLAKPAINAGFLNPINDLHLAGILDAPKPYDVTPGRFLSPEWWAQTVGSVAGVLPYIVAARAIGGASRFAAEATGTETSMFRQFAASERLTMVAGAGIYDFVRTPHQGEARWSNSLAGMAMFGMCEWGNSRIPASTSFGEAALERMKYGAGGAASSYFISHTLGPEHIFKSADFIQTSFTGGLINFGLPALQSGAKGANPIDTATGGGVPAERVLSGNGSSENPQLSDLVNRPRGRLTPAVNYEPSPQQHAARQTAETPVIGPDGKVPVQDQQHEAQSSKKADPIVESAGTYRPQISCSTPESLTVPRGLAFEALPGKTVIATEGSFVTARSGSVVFGQPGSKVTAEAGSMVRGMRDSSLIAKAGSQVVAESGCCVTAYQGAKVWVACGALLYNYGATIMRL